MMSHQVSQPSDRRERLVRRCVMAASVLIPFTMALQINQPLTRAVNLLGFLLLAMMLLAAAVAPRSQESRVRDGSEISAIAVASLFVVVSSFLDGANLVNPATNEKMLRISVLISFLVVPLNGLLGLLVSSRRPRLILATMLVPVATLGTGSLLTDDLSVMVSFSIAGILLAAYLGGILRLPLAAALSLLTLVDPLAGAGFISFDVESPRLMNSILKGALALTLLDLGAAPVLALATRAYERFTRDISLREIANLLTRQFSGNQVVADRAAYKQFLPIMAEIMEAGRVSLLINLPYGRPVTYSFDALTEKLVTHDDGRIPGAVTLRAFVYGDECWFMRYSDFANKLGLPVSRNLDADGYVCISPIRVQNNNVGVLMLTCFDDQEIVKKIKKDSINDLRDNGLAIVHVIESVLSDVLVRNMKTHAAQSASILGKIREAIPQANSSMDFLHQYCRIIHQVTGLRTLIHQRVEDCARGVSCAGLGVHEWDLFLDRPIDLTAKDPASLGQTAVSFVEGKSTYLKDWREIREKLHPKTSEILNRLDARSVFGIPLRSGDEQYVVTLVSSAREGSKDPGISEMIEATDAMFDAALTVLGQKNSALALDKLASRLIGDESVRSQIVNAAVRQDDLPTTIGAPRRSFLLLFDLVGSSGLTADTEEKARAYGLFYDAVNKSVQSLLGGKIRKTIGDAMIATWDGTDAPVEDQPLFLDHLASVVLQAEDVALSVGCKGVRAVLHHGDYFFGLVGTSSFGQIDVIGRGIDEVCKLEGAMKSLTVNGVKVKIGISGSAFARLPQAVPANLAAHNFVAVEHLVTSPDARSALIVWACALPVRHEAKSTKVEVRPSVISPLVS